MNNNNNNRRKQIENVSLAIAVGTIVAGATYSLYRFFKDKNTPCLENQHENYDRDSESDEVCPICYNPMSSNCTRLSCDHLFHRKCIEEWHAINRTCPICRAPF